MEHETMWQELGLDVSLIVGTIGAALAADNMSQACKEVLSP